MKHLKRFFESSEEVDVNTMAKILYDFFTNFDWSTESSNMETILKKNNDDIQEWSDEFLTIPEIEVSITNIINDKSFRVREYNEFMDTYNEILAMMPHEIDTEEIDDLFLDIEHEYFITKAVENNYPIFYVKIEKVKEADVLKMFTQLWNVVSNRVPDGYSTSEIRMEDFTKSEIGYLFTIVFRGPYLD